MSDCIYRIFKQRGIMSDGRDKLTKFVVLGSGSCKYFNLSSIEGVIEILKEIISKNVSLETIMQFSFHPEVDITIFRGYSCILSSPLSKTEIERIWSAITNFIEEIRQSNLPKDKE